MPLRDPVILDHTLEAAERAALEELAGGLRERYGERLLELRLFGSRARGDATEESDIDLLVVLDVPAAEEDGATDGVWELVARVCTAARGPVPIRPLVMGAQRYTEGRQRGVRLVREIEREGIRL